MRWKYWNSEDDLADQWLWPGETTVSLSASISRGGAAPDAASASAAAASDTPLPATPKDDGASVLFDRLSAEVHAELIQAAGLMRLTQVRTDPLFAGVDGHGTTVVIIDTGADLNHPAFGPDSGGNGIADRIAYQFDFVGANDSNATDGNGHGTHVAGIVGSQNATYTGMAPGVSFIVLRVLNDSGSGTLTDIEEAFQWVVAHRTEYNIVSVSMSIGDSQNVNFNQNNALSNEVATLWNAGIATVVAAGNSFASFNTPGVNGLAATPFAWGVASTLDNANTFSSFSQRSSTMTEIAAPGSNISSAYLNDGYATLSGTSMATPMISGLVALAQDLSQEITGGLKLAPATILSIMRSTGVNVSDGTTTVPRVDALNLMYGIVSFYQQSSANADVIYGWRSNDTLAGLGGDDIIRANLGDDAIDGGAGNDTAIFSGVRAAYTLTALGGTSVRVSGPDGTDTLNNVEWLRFDDQTASAVTNSDLDALNLSLGIASLVSGGATTVSYTVSSLGSAAAAGSTVGLFRSADAVFDASDTLLTIRSTGQLAAGTSSSDSFSQMLSAIGTYYLIAVADYNGQIWETNESNNPSNAVQVTVTAGQSVANDFNADGLSDLLLQNSHGLPAIWTFNSGAVTSATALYDPGPTWHAIAAADFSGDRKADILWQNDSGLPAIWTMDGSTMTSGALLPNWGPSWHAIAAADLSGDGKADILWQNDNGAPAVWTMDGTTVTGTAVLVNPQPSWHAIAAADFNGDGKADILWQNDNGTPAIWTMDGTTMTSGAHLFNPGLGWHAKAAADFTGDGKADILWQHDNGTPAIWTMNGTTMTSGAHLYNPGPTWHIEDAFDVTGDGKADILWQHDNGTPAIWTMDGTTMIAGALLPNPSPDWHLV
jgi:subtilisin family serine protease